MPLELLWLVVGIALLLIAAAILLLSVSLVRLAADLRRLVRATQQVVGMAEQEVPATLGHLRSLSENLDRLSAEAEPRVRRVDDLLDEAEASLVALRSSLEATEEIVRAPLDAVSRARHGVTSIGRGIAHRAGLRGRPDEAVRSRPGEGMRGRPGEAVRGPAGDSATDPGGAAAPGTPADRPPG